jgi:hypothetical protein
MNGAARVLTAIGALLVPAAANAQSLVDALTDGTPLADVRLRYETIDQSNKPETAEANTVRARLGYQSGAYLGFTGLVEVDIVQHFGPQDFNDTLNGKIQYPAVPDPDMVALNRLQLAYATRLFADPDAMPDLRLTLGRQRIQFGDQRFIGNAGWRQHEQTYDAITAADSPLRDLTVTYAYVLRVNRIFGPRSEAGTFNSHSHLFNAVYTGVPHLKLEGYAYLLDFLQAPTLSTATIGIRGESSFAVGPVTLNLNAAAARQEDYARNPLAIDLAYYLVEGGLAYDGFTGTVGYEVLQGNGVIGFQTPLASLHLFQGWAESFVVNPPNGVEDLYVKATYTILVPLIERLSVTGIHHDFSAERVRIDYGSEWDARLEAQIDRRLVLDADYADFDGKGAFPHKKGFWLYATWRY